MKQRHIIIVGGGAAGLVSAITAARNGAKVTLIEQKNRLGKKILSTGNGRCNLTNEIMTPSCYYGDDLRIIETVLLKFGYKDTMHFFEELGVLLKQRQGYVYPITDQATTIADVLSMAVENAKINILLNQSVQEIKKSANEFIVKTKDTTIKGDAVILATGGKAAPVLGSDGSGYSLAKSFGHHLSPVVPALVQLKCSGHQFKDIAGVRTNAKVSLYVDSQYVAEDTGELQLTQYGISGIPVFQISRHAAKALYAKKNITVEIDYLPDINEIELRSYISNRLLTKGAYPIKDFLIGMLPSKLISLFLNELHINARDTANKLKEKMLNEFVTLCKHFSVDVTATNGFDQAQVCAGGVKTNEINHETMESLLCNDLYIVGELQDVDGICGGYNLQWAWATGFIAANAATKGK